MTNIIFGIIGTLLALIWLFLLFTDKKRYEAIIEEVDGNEYFLKDLFFIGFRVIGLLEMNLSSPSLQKKVRKLSEMVGLKEAKKLALTDLAAQISYIMTFAPLGFLLTVMADDALCLFIAFGMTAFLVIYVEYDKNNKLQKRHAQILREFPHMLSQMALLVNAGMPLREALVTTSQKENGILSEEMRTLSDDMANGIPEYEAFSSFADRCGVDSVRKFSSLITQNVKKGSSELAAALMELSNEVWRNRVSSVKEEGEKASTKLLVPILIIFIGIIMMVVVPMFSNITF